jgi:hypothetical protein
MPIACNTHTSPRSNLLRGLCIVPLALPCCIEYNPWWARKDPPPSDDTAAEPFEPLRPANIEICDGLDNDGDGMIDEGFQDTDLDGSADCVDTECVVDLTPAGTTDEESQCQSVAQPSAGAWDIELLWERWSTDSADQHTCGPGGLVYDFGGDGVSDILCDSIAGSWQVEHTMFSGADGTREWRSQGGEQPTWLAAGDIDSDNEIEFIGVGDGGFVSCYQQDGSLEWSSDAFVGQQSSRTSFEIVDLDRDGLPEVFTCGYLLDGATGAILSELPTEWQGECAIAVADLQLDGDIELLDGGLVMSRSGDVLWSVEAKAKSWGEGRVAPMLLQADGDDEAEVVHLSSNVGWLSEPDGTLLATWDMTQDAWPWPSGGDIDGDGMMEIVHTASEWNEDDSSYTHMVQAREADGTELWSVEIQDDTAESTGVTTFDFDLDGAREVLVVDGEAMSILDGRTGTSVYRYPVLDNATGGDSPLVADLDNDGSVEIVLTINTTLDLQHNHPYIMVLGNVHRDWPPGLPLWTTANWTGVELNLDGTVPRERPAPWLTTEVWRGQPELWVKGNDLRPEITDWCASSCEDDGQVHVAVRLINKGPDAVQRSTKVAVWAEDLHGSWSWLGSIELASYLGEQVSSPAQEFIVDTATARRGLRLVAGADATGRIVGWECAPDDNTLEWRLTDCD